MIALATVAYINPRFIREQTRLLRLHLRDPFTLLVVDASPHVEQQDVIQDLCRELRVGYIHSLLPAATLTTPAQNQRWAFHNLRQQGGGSTHSDALATVWPLISSSHYFGLLDHDVFPVRSTTLIDKINRCGFYGHPRESAHGSRWLWPGFALFGRNWLADRQFATYGPQGGNDVFEATSALFSDADWQLFQAPPHGPFEPADGSDRYARLAMEQFGDWVHMVNSTGWSDAASWSEMEDREERVFEYLASLT